jgi:hypothetical protein
MDMGKLASVMVRTGWRHRPGPPPAFMTRSSGRPR